MLLRAGFRCFTAQCYYSLLGVPRDAEPDAIKAAYYSLAKLHHPDQQRSGDSAPLFAQLTEAYSTLMDEEKRYEYDLQKGFLTAMDVDRMEGLREKYGSRYVSKDLWKAAVTLDKSLGEEVAKDAFFAPKAVFSMLFRKSKQKTEKKEEEGNLLDDVRIFRQATFLCLTVGFVVSYNLTTFAIETLLFPTSPPQ